MSLRMHAHALLQAATFKLCQMSDSISSLRIMSWSRYDYRVFLISYMAHMVTHGP